MGLQAAAVTLPRVIPPDPPTTATLIAPGSIVLPCGVGIARSQVKLGRLRDRGRRALADPGTNASHCRSTQAKLLPGTSHAVLPALAAQFIDFEEARREKGTKE
ncbi:MAG: hypothetical protein ACREYC_15625 [Gammaproteobacteria bacterium]